ncbi:LytTR family DNA-binding domain-containing protein [Desulfurispirillum indicum]|uniref:Response regulator receiver n=1 Tax=Desulfurispirillum indicum (strain ATCC BAA-1389 / DSM 22839 / S5) TaxID=653733 RepID=E6W190_DESIS|nr:LytTR family DNA-binding domain-containing protein [Desulfurispirillum indicum]ADU66510.1 response regulator receiver [Desulfurispirillum indicum S5]UCZ55843.1 LytTR family DNA-binding domain-containing protein [Desulfurispirillum indicum]
MRVVIVEDEAPAVDELKYILRQAENVEVVADVQNGLKSLDVIKKLKPDVVFLDIELPDMNGFEVATELLEYAHRPLIIFCTAYDEYAIKAFEVNAVDYILKPYNDERILQALERAKGRLEEKKIYHEQLRSAMSELTGNRIRKIVVESRGKLKVIDQEEIYWIGASVGKTEFHTHEEMYYSNHTLQNLEKILDDKLFLRIHRSHIINLNRVRELIPWFSGSFQVGMDDKAKTNLAVGRDKVKILKNILNY